MTAAFPVNHSFQEARKSWRYRDLLSLNACRSFIGRSCNTRHERQSSLLASDRAVGVDFADASTRGSAGQIGTDSRVYRSLFVRTGESAILGRL